MKPATDAMRILYAGSADDQEVALLRSLGERVSVAVAPSSERLLEGDGLARVDALVAANPIDGATLGRLEKTMAVVVIGQDANGGCSVALPRNPDRTSLALALELAKERHRREVAAPSFSAMVFATAPVGIALTSAEGLILDVNAALGRLLGYAPEELVGRPVSQLGSLSATGTTHRSTFRRAVGADLNVTTEKKLRRKDGSLVRAQVSSSVLRDDHGSPIALVQSVVDLTGLYEAEERLEAELEERSTAEDAAREGQEFYVNALLSLPLGVLLVDRPTGRPILVNRRFREMHCSLEAIDAAATGLDLDLAFSREDGAPYPAAMLPLTRTLADGKPHSANDIWLDRPDGGRIPLAAYSAPISHHGRSAAVLVLQDVTTARDEERQRRAAEVLYRDLFEQVTDGIFVVTMDKAATIVDVNPAGEKLYGYGRGELAGRGASQLAPPEQPDGRSSAGLFLGRLEAVRDQRVVRFPWRGQARSGALLDLEMTVQPLRLEGSPDLLLIQARDVTRQRILEDDLRQAQKLEAIGVLAGGIAHDYNNLLTGVMGFIDLAVDRLPAGDDRAIARVRQFLGEARRGADRSADLTRQLLTFSRRSHAKTEVADLNKCVAKSSSMIQRLIGESVRLEVHLAPEGCPIRGDSSQLEQVLMNLAINARDAMPRGGSLHVRTLRYRAGSEGRVLDLAPGEYVLLEVADTGTGMSDSVRARIFTPFFSTKAPGRGTGLGLAVVQSVVERHGGKIFVDSKVGEGSRFSVILPCVLGEEAPASAPASSGPIPRGAESLLVVDDDPVVRDVTATMLETLGYSVSRACGGAEALELLERSAFHLVISDVVMPDMTGVELERRLRVERPSLKVLLVSGYAQDAFARQGIDESEVAALIRKPLTLEALGRKVRELLGAH